MKVPKMIQYDPITGRKIGLARAFKIAVAPDGSLVEWSTAGDRECPLPPGYRFARPDEITWGNDE